MAFLEEFGEVRIGYRLPGKGYGDLVGIAGLVEPLHVAAGIPFESGYELPLLLDQRIEHLLGFDPVLDLEVMLLHPPAERAAVAAFVDGRGHLETAVGLDPVEVLLVAVPLPEHALLHPMAKLHCSMVPAEAVLLLDQEVAVCIVHVIRNRIGCVEPWEAAWLEVPAREVRP